MRLYSWLGLSFNERMEIGLPKLLAELDLEEGPRSKAYFSTTDKVRFDKSERIANAVAKKRKKR